MEEVGPMLAKIKNKELVSEWKEKGEKKGLFGRKSIDRRPCVHLAPALGCPGAWNTGALDHSATQGTKSSDRGNTHIGFLF
eukprot:1147936-Pelagomonas_calceolata.AAC.1